MRAKYGVMQAELRLLSFLAAAEGFLALIWTFAVPSEIENAVFLGYSAERWLLGICTAIVAIGFAAFAFWRTVHQESSHLEQNLITAVTETDRLYFIYCACIALFLFSAWFLLFTWLLFPENFRPQALWMGLIGLQSALVLRVRFYSRFCEKDFFRRYRLFPRFQDLSQKQRHVFFILVLIGLIYIAVLMPANINGTTSIEAFDRYGGDEAVIYPLLMDVMAPGDTFSAVLYHLFIYEDYHYGYPFYALSTLILWPIKVYFGADYSGFRTAVQINLPLLRVFVSVIPFLMAAMTLSFLFTRWKSFLLSPAVFLFLIIAPGSLQNNQGFWHPDGLNLLFICLTLYFLSRDQYRYGRNFFLTAVCIGLSVAVRLYGAFFVLAVGVYLLIGFVHKKLSLWKAFQLGLIFVIVMGAVILIADPFLFRADAREKMVAILSEKSGEMQYGYVGDHDPRNDYRTGWDAWYPAFEDHFTEMFCFFFLLVGLGVGCFTGSNRLICQMTLCWVGMIGGYLIIFVAVKSTQYVLPMLIPLMGSIFILPLAVEHSLGNSRTLRFCVWCSAWVIYLVQIVINTIKILPRFF